MLTPMESVSRSSFVLLGHLAMLLASTLAINYWLGGFLGKAVGIIHFVKHYLDFIVNTLI